MIDDALASRLLTAAYSTYFRDPAAEAGGLVQAAIDRNSAVGYVAPPAVFIDGTIFQWEPPFRAMLPDITLLAARDAVTIGATATEIIVAFRGTIPFDGAKDKLVAIGDWLNDFNAVPIRSPGVDGWVHPGFAEAVENLWTETTTALAPLLAANPLLPVCFTGHSKGGAMAHIAAVRFWRQTHSHQVLVCTFAAAKAGDVTFTHAFDAAVADSRRYEYGDDVVPQLPSNGGLSLNPGALFPGLDAGLAAQFVGLGQAYRSAGKLFYLPRLAPGGPTPPAGRPLQQSEVNPTRRIQDIIAALPNLTFPLEKSWVAVHHDIAPPSSGYYRWVHR